MAPTRGIETWGALLVLALVASCARGPQDGEARCEQVKGELASCLGDAARRLDCASVSTADLERLSAASQNVSCALLAEAMPLDGDPRSATCRLLGVGCVPATTPAPTRSPTKYPIVLVNGIDASPLFTYNRRIVETMTGVGGHAVFLATLTPYEPPRVRAPELWARIKEVRKQTGAAKVNLVCHSLGGLDCRYLVSPGGLPADMGDAAEDTASAVASITTVATAHLGTRLADVLLGALPDGDRGRTLNDFTTLVGDWFSDKSLAQNLALRDALAALSVAEAPAFNASIVDAGGVYYQSWAGYSRPLGVTTPDHDARVAALCKTTDGDSGTGDYSKQDFMALTLVPFTDTVGHVDGTPGITPNDGLVAVSSAKWGNFRGCIPADHMEQLGQRNIPDVNVENGFDVAKFYTNVAGDLSGRGF